MKTRNYQVTLESTAGLRKETVEEIIDDLRYHVTNIDELADPKSRNELVRRAVQLSWSKLEKLDSEVIFGGGGSHFFISHKFERICIVTFEYDL